MLELLALLLVVAAAGGAVMLVAGLLIGGVVAVCVAILFVVLAVLGLIGKILFLPLAAMLWVLTHPLLSILLIVLAVVILRDRRHAPI